MKCLQIVERIREVLQMTFPHGKIILYGGEARSDARPDSAIDLLILVDGSCLSVQEEEYIISPLYICNYDLIENKRIEQLDD